MAISNEAVMRVVDHYVKTQAEVKADDTSAKWFPKHEDEVTRQVRELHETLGEFWKYGNIR